MEYRPERMLLVCDDLGDTHIMAAKGPCIEHEVTEIGARAEYFGLENLLSAQEIRVYETTPYNDPMGKVEYDKGLTRNLNPAEWKALSKSGDANALFHLWSDIKSLYEYDLRKTKEYADDLARDAKIAEEAATNPFGEPKKLGSW